jgi:sarcosine oxidase/L-pipecolate oxidase
MPFESRYQALAIEARNIWLSWNKAIEESSPDDLPLGLTPEDKLLYTCGCYFLAEPQMFLDFEAKSLETMEKMSPELRKMQFVKVWEL